MATPDLIERLPRKLSLRELRVFVCVLDEGSFRKAAGVLHVTQPAVTKAIAGLEDLLGVRLFDRAPNGVRPTLQGTTFAKYARAIFGELRGAATEIDAVSRGMMGVLRLGTVPLPAGGFLPMAVRALIDRHPGVSVSIVEGRESEVCNLVRNQEVDVALVRLAQLPPNDDLEIDVLFEAQLYVLAARNHRLASQPVVTWPELERERWVLSPRDSDFSKHVRRTLARVNLEMPRASVESSSIHVQRAMALHGGMLSFGSRPRQNISPLHDVLVRLPFELPPATNAIGAVTLRGRTRWPLAVHLLSEIRRLAEVG